MVPFDSAESVTAFVRTAQLEGGTFELPIADGITLAGKPDLIGAAMAFVVDALLARGLEPDGFEQRDGYRIYRFKSME